MSELDKALLLNGKIEVLSGFAFPSSGFNQLDGLPLIRIRDLSGSTTEVRFRGVYDPAYRVSKGDLLVGMDGDFEVYRWEGEDALLNQRVCKISSTSREIDQGFLYWYLKPNIAEIHRRTPQTTVRHLSTKDIYAIAEPPVGFPAQECIAQILDTLDTAIRETEALIDKLKAVKQGLLHDLLTRGIDANGQLRPPQSEAPQLYKESPLGWIPREWEICPLHQQADVIDPQPDHRTPKEQEDGVPYIGIGDFDEHGRVRFSSCRRVVQGAFEKQRQRFKIEDGDIIYGKIGTIGKPKRLVAGDYALTANVLLLKPKYSPALFFMLLTSAFEGQILDITNTTSQPALGIETVRNLLVYKVPRTESDLISERLNSIFSQISEETAMLYKLKQQKSGLMDDLLTGHVRVTPLLESVQRTAEPTEA